MNVKGITPLVFVAWGVLASSAQASTMTVSGKRATGVERTRAATLAIDPDQFFSNYCSDVGRDLTRVVSWRDTDDAFERSFDGPFRLLHNGDVAPLLRFLRWHFKHDWKEDWDDWRHDFGTHRRVGRRHHRDRGEIGEPVTAAIPAPEPGSLVLLISGAAIGLRRLRRYSAGVKPV